MAPEGALRTTLALLLLLAAAIPRPGHAQVVRVLAAEATSGQPLPSVIVELLAADAAGSTASQSVAAAITAQNGRRTFAVRAGRYRVRARRIGFQPFLSDVIALAAGDTADVTARMPAQRIELPTIVVTGESRCEARGGTAHADVATVWEEARKALTATELSRETGRSGARAGLRAQSFERLLDAHGSTIGLYLLPPRTLARRPFEARPPAELSAQGYVRHGEFASEYLAPDERVLLSDEFAADHCFTLVAAPPSAEALVGVAFAPTPGRRAADIAGTLWIDSASAELRYLDFHFVDRALMREASGVDRAGGQVVFERLDDGTWIVSAWRLRMPRLEPVRPPAIGLELAGYRELGAVVALSSTTAAPRPPTLATVLAPYLALTVPARLTGVVRDSLADAPLSGARVWATAVPDTAWSRENVALVRPDEAPSFETRSDSAGRYTLDSLPGGYYRVGFARADLDSAGLRDFTRTVRLSPAADTAVDLGLPARATFEDGCTVSAGVRMGRRGVVYGTVRRASDGALLRGATVTLRWMTTDAGEAALGTARPMSLTTRTDDEGGYRICDLPLARPIPASAVASADGATADTAAIVLGEPRDVTRRDFVIPPRAATPSRRARSWVRARRSAAGCWISSEHRSPRQRSSSARCPIVVRRS